MRGSWPVCLAGFIKVIWDYSIGVWVSYGEGFTLYFTMNLTTIACDQILYVMVVCGIVSAVTFDWHRVLEIYAAVCA